MANNICAKLECEVETLVIIGLGYVGLPLANQASKKYKVIGIDIDVDRVNQLRAGIDVTNEVEDLDGLKRIQFTTEFDLVSEADLIIVTVPTPIDAANNPNLQPLKTASTSIGKHISEGAVIVFESTVYPGVTDDVLRPIIEETSGLRVNEGFFLGYSPERINPGDKGRGVETIIKVTSGSTEGAAVFIDNFYASIIDAGTHKAPSIKVAEAAKVIENIQRDLNIALVNELSIIFGKLDIETSDVLDAAATKWNFVKYSPGLVGGHCIGVDPYYLTYRAREVGYVPRVILAGRELNDNMHLDVIDRSIRALIEQKINIGEARALVLGYTFKENCPDLRNTRVKFLVEELETLFDRVDVFDPYVNPSQCEVPEFKNFPTEIGPDAYEYIVLAVPHDEFIERGSQWITELRAERSVFFDIKNAFRDIDDSLSL